MIASWLGLLFPALLAPLTLLVLLTLLASLALLLLAVPMMLLAATAAIESA